MSRKEVVTAMASSWAPAEHYQAPRYIYLMLSDVAALALSKLPHRCVEEVTEFMLVQLKKEHQRAYSSGQRAEHLLSILRLCEALIQRCCGANEDLLIAGGPAHKVKSKPKASSIPPERPAHEQFPSPGAAQ